MGLFFDSMLWDITTILSIISALVYHYLTHNFSFWERLNIPYIKPEILFGNMREIVTFKNSQFEVFSDFYQHFKKNGHKFGGIFQLTEPILLVCSNDLAKDILVKNFLHFHDRKLAYDEHFDPLSTHLISLEGQKWKFIRSKLNPAFSTSRLKVMLNVMKDIGDGYVKILTEAAEKKEMLEMRDSFSRYALDVIGAAAFGLNVNSLQTDSKFMEMGRKFFEPTHFERIVQIIANTNIWLYRLFKLRMIPKDVTDFFMGTLKDTMEYRRKENVQLNDFLHFLMKINEVKGANLKDMEEMSGVENYNMSVNENSIELTEGVIAAQAFVFLIAGYETSSSTMSACIFTLAHHPEIQDKLHEEVSRVWNKHGDFTYEALQELVYVEQVLEETLRVYPPVGLLIRQCTKSYQVPDTDIVIPKGVQAFLPIYSFHYDPEYFPEPKEFRPERFSPENRKNILPYTYMPFGQGPRVCIGMRVAMMELKLSLALMMKNFKVVTCEKTKPFRISPKSFFMVAADGYWVRLVKR